MLVLNSKPLDWLDYGARFYDTQIARWMTIDPSSEKYYEKNPYGYASNNPIAKFDLDGKDDYFSIYTGRFLYSDGSIAGNIRMVNPFFLSNLNSLNGFNMVDFSRDIRNNSFIPKMEFFNNAPNYIANNILNYYYQEAGYNLSDLKNNTVSSTFRGGLAYTDFDGEKFDINVRKSDMGTGLQNRWDYINMYKHERGGHGMDYFAAKDKGITKYLDYYSNNADTWESNATKFQMDDSSWGLTSLSFKQTIYNSYGWKFFPNEFKQYNIYNINEDWMDPIFDY